MTVESEDVPKATWQMAERASLVGLDIDAIVGSCTSAEASDYGSLFGAALDDVATPNINRPALEMLRAIMWMYATPDPDRPPFGPVFQAANGARSAAPDDFAGPLVDVVAACLEISSHPIVRARLSHLVWFLKRHRRATGLQALDAYREVLEQVDSGALSISDDPGALSISGHDLLAIAFNVSRGLGYPKKPEESLRTMARQLFQRACVSEKQWAVLRFGELTLDRARIDPKEVAQGIEKFISNSIAPLDNDGVADLWHLAERAYRRAKDRPEAHRCQAEAAESLVRMAEHFADRERGLSIAAHWMAQAIGAYHGHPEARKRRTELRHRLIDLQAGIPDEMVPISHSTDITDLVASAEEHFSGIELPKALLRFAVLQGPPDPEKLLEAAREASAKHPLSAMFSKTYMDAEGKTVARSLGVDLGPEGPSGDLEPEISQSESIRRSFAVRGQIEVGRATISLEHRLSKRHFLKILEFSPAAPPRLLNTMADGFSRYFEGDMTAALYILTPLLEGVLRHVLKSAGHDVTTIDAATSVQQERTISSIYQNMRTELDDIFGRDLTEDIRRVFLSRIGPNLRHGVAHALLSDGAPYSDDVNYSCWLMWRLIVWPLVPHWDEVFKQE